jgi:threonine dehydratase
MISNGAEIVFCDPTMESRIQTCSEIVSSRDMTEVPPFNHVWTMSGQGTIALEVASQVDSLDAYLVAVGGCGLISGIIVAAKALNPRVKVFGAEPTALDDTAASLREGVRRGPTDPTATSICDALRVTTGPLCWEIVSKGCDGVFTVSDDRTIDAMRLLMTELKQVTEPSGAVATAALFTPEFIDILKNDASINSICVVICGGNIGIDTLKAYI